MSYLTEVMPQPQGSGEPQSPEDTTQKPADVEPKTPEDSTSEGQQKDKGTGEGAEDEGKGKPQLSDSDRAIRSLQRRVSRLTQEKAVLAARMSLVQPRRAEESPQADPDEDDDEGTDDGWTDPGKRKPPARPATPKLTEQEVNRRAAALAAVHLEAGEHVKSANAAVHAGRKAFKEFDTMLRTVADEVGGFYEDDAQGGRPLPIARAIFEETDEPHKVIRYLAENPEVAAELGDLPARRQIRRLAQIEAEMGQATKPKPSNAPKPVDAPKGSPTGSDEPDPKNAEAWIAWRNGKLAKRA
jgi:hypothetical protein